MAGWTKAADEWPGNRGSERGFVRLDEVHDGGLRITLEEAGATAPWSITCGVAGLLVHTTFASTEPEARAKIEDMKVRLLEIAAAEDPNALAHRFVDDFP